MSDQPHILIVGVGSIGERHLRCFQSTDRCTVSLCEPRAGRRNEVMQRYSVQGYPTWEQAVEQETFSAAVIASPAPFHVPTAEALADRGIDLLIEKPLALSTDGLCRLLRRVEQRNSRVAVGFVYRAMPALQKLRSAVQTGEFGRIVQIQVMAGQHFPCYRPAYREIYYADPEQGGGLMQDMLPHPLNAVEWIAGPASSVIADASHQVLADVDVEDTVNVLARHGDIMVSYSLNQHQPVNEYVITVLGDRGAARWELVGGRWLSANVNGGDWSQRDAFVHDRDDYYIGQADSFLDVLAGKAEPLCSLADGVETLMSMLAVLKSSESRTWEPVSRWDDGVVIDE